MMFDTFWLMFLCLIFLLRLHNHSGPYHNSKCYVTIKNKKIARLLMSDWLDGLLHVRHMYPEYLNKLSCIGLLEYILIGLGYLWVLWIVFIEKNYNKAYTYGQYIAGVALLFAIIKRQNASKSIKYYRKLVKEGKLDLFGNSKEKNEE